MLYAHDIPIEAKKGKNFEKYVERVMFPDSRYVLRRRSEEFHNNMERYAEQSLDPDMVFRCKETGKEFAVEIKYRSRPYYGKLAWSKKYQLQRYKDYDAEQLPVIVVVGYGGISTAPERLFIFPVRKIKYISLYFDIADKYLFNGGEVENTYLWDLLENT